MKVIVILFTLIFSTLYATDSKTANSCSFESGELMLETFLDACPSLAHATSSSRVHSETIGKIVNYHGDLYEIRVESFEDTLETIPENMNFYQYASQNNLLSMKSKKVYPISGICFECFDFRYANLNDGVYFTIVLRKI